MLMRDGHNGPGVGGVGRHARGVAGAETGAAAMPELLGSHSLVAPVAEAPDVAVVVNAAQRERLDVVGNGGRLDDAALDAEAADRFGSEAALALLDTGPTAQPISHRGPQTQEEPLPLRARLHQLPRV